MESVEERELRTRQVKAYVEPRIEDALEEYADRQGMTKSTVMRKMIIDCLKADRRQRRILAEAEHDIEFSKSA